MISKYVLIYGIAILNILTLLWTKMTNLDVITSCESAILND